MAKAPTRINFLPVHAIPSPAALVGVETTAAATLTVFALMFFIFLVVDFYLRESFPPPIGAGCGYLCLLTDGVVVVHRVILLGSARPGYAFGVTVFHILLVLPAAIHGDAAAALSSPGMSGVNFSGGSGGGGGGGGFHVIFGLGDVSSRALSARECLKFFLRVERRRLFCEPREPSKVDPP